jgi:hypothetical protein
MKCRGNVTRAPPLLVHFKFDVNLPSTLGDK